MGEFRILAALMKKNGPQIRNKIKYFFSWTHWVESEHQRVLSTINRDAEEDPGQFLPDPDEIGEIKTSFFDYSEERTRSR